MVLETLPAPLLCLEGPHDDRSDWTCREDRVMHQISGDGYTLLLIHTWILYAVPAATAVVAFVIGRLSKSRD